MPRVDPFKVISPVSRIKRVVQIIHDGAKLGTDISIVELELKNKNSEKTFGIRWDISYWSANPDLGFPSSRGNPTWFIIPKKGMENLLKSLESLKDLLPDLEK